MGPDDLVLCAGTLRRGPASPSAWPRRWGRVHGGVPVGTRLRRGPGRGPERRRPAHHARRPRTGGGGVDPAWWWLPGATEVRIPAEYDTEDVFRFGEDDLFAVADALGARSINAVDVFGGTWDVDQAAEAFAGLCTRAREHGLLVHIEWLAWSRIPDLATARRIVELADQPNGGLCVDTWHLVRSGDTTGDLATVPGGLILAVQLDDGPSRPSPTWCPPPP